MGKPIVGAASVIAALALAMVLFGSTSGSAEAVIHGISAAPSTTAGAGSTITLTIDADEGGGDVTIVTTEGTFGTVLCTTNAVTTPSVDCTLDATDPAAPGTVGAGGATIYILDDDTAGATGGMDLITASLVCPVPGPAAPTVAAIQGASVMSITLTCTQGTGLVGVLPPSGFGLVTYGGTIDELRDELLIVCANGAPIFASQVVGSVGSLVPFFPTAVIIAPNAAFLALFPDGIPDHTPLIGGNCG